nr:MAG TPA: hypothetical protein [Caudoviricetes sp.]
MLEVELYRIRSRYLLLQFAQQLFSFHLTVLR